MKKINIKSMAAVVAVTILAFETYAAAGTPVVYAAGGAQVPVAPVAYSTGGGTTVSLSPLGNTAPAPQETAAEGDTVKVQGRGVGMDTASALKDAYRDAIERAVGLYVDAETVAQNDQLVKDDILTHSNAYITDYRELDEKKLDGGLVQLRILATVKKQALTAKLSGVMPAQTFQLGNEGAQAHANQLTQEKRVEDAAALLENALKGINPITQLVRMSLADTRMLRKEVGLGRSRAPGEPNASACFYKFKLELDIQKYYREFLPPLLRVLDQIALVEPKTVRFSSNGMSADQSRNRSRGGRSSRAGNSDDNARYLAGEWDYMYDSDNGIYSRPVYAMNMGGRRELMGMNINSVSQVLPMVHCGVVVLRGTAEEWSLSTPRGGGGWWACMGKNCDMDHEIHDSNRQWAMRNAEESINEEDGFQVVVITEVNESRTIAKAKYYRLPKACARVVIDWQAKLLGEVYNVYTKESVGTHYAIVFKDAGGAEIYSQPCEIKNVLLTNTMVGCGPMFTRGQKMQGGCMVGYGWYVTPMIHTDAQSLQGWIGFDIPLDDLPKIRAVTIELAD